MISILPFLNVIVTLFTLNDKYVVMHCLLIDCVGKLEANVVSKHNQVSNVESVQMIHLACWVQLL